jgi:hypothetical protein
MSGLLADFASRFTFGLAAALLLAPWRAIPPRYFRTVCLSLMGLAILAAFDVATGRGRGWPLTAAILAALAAYASTVAWSLGYPRLGQLALLIVCAGAALIQAWWVMPGLGTAAPHVGAVAARMVPGVVLGSTLAAMLLGHHYLTAPAMSIGPLKRMIVTIAVALAVDAALALGHMAVARPALSSMGALLVLMRWGFGIVGPAIGTFLAWRTALIRSTQSATGILYAGLTLALLGELASLVLERAY